MGTVFLRKRGRILKGFLAAGSPDACGGELVSVGRTARGMGIGAGGSTGGIASSAGGADSIAESCGACTVAENSSTPVAMTGVGGSTRGGSGTGSGGASTSSWITRRRYLRARADGFTKTFPSTPSGERDPGASSARRWRGMDGRGDENNSLQGRVSSRSGSKAGVFCPSAKLNSPRRMLNSSGGAE